MATETLIRLFEDSKSSGQCRGCQARIEWFETLKGKKMPMDAGAVPRKSTRDNTGRVVAYYASAESHFNTCRERAQFTKR